MDIFTLIALCFTCSILGAFTFILITFLLLKKSKALRSFIINNSGLDKYINKVGGVYKEILSKKEDIQNTLKNSVGKNDAEVINKIDNIYNELDKIMKKYIIEKEFWDNLTQNKIENDGNNKTNSDFSLNKGE